MPGAWTLVVVAAEPVQAAHAAMHNMGSRWADTSNDSMKMWDIVPAAVRTQNTARGGTRLVHQET